MATPNTAPWISPVHPECVARSGPHTMSISTTATPLNAPASIESSR
ncbi:hypothetical protein ABZW47_23590 [Streptomyces sp. NPDC004549]